jgi:hypothetical protein
MLQKWVLAIPEQIFLHLIVLCAGGLAYFAGAGVCSTLAKLLNQSTKK